MKKLGLVIIGVSLLTGCMTKSLWNNNPVSGFTYHYEEEYKDVITEVVKLELNEDKEPLVIRDGSAISLRGMSLASKTRIYNISYGDYPLKAIYKYMPKMNFSARIAPQGAVPFEIQNRHVNIGDNFLASDIQGVFLFSINPEVKLLESEIKELEQAHFKQECKAQDGSLQWCINFWINANVFERNQTRYTITVEKVLPKPINIALYDLKGTPKTNVGNLVGNIIGTPVFIIGDVLLAPLGALLGVVVQSAGN